MILRPMTLVILLVASLAGIGAARADIVVGVVGPLTSVYSVFGDQIRRGAEHAVRNINKAGGVLGQPLRLEFGDDACSDPVHATGIADQMVARQTAVVIGHFCSVSSIAASDVYLRARVVQITPASSDPMLTERGHPHVFRTIPREDAQGAFAADHVLDQGLSRKIAIVHDGWPRHQARADEFKRQLNARGVTELMYETVLPMGGDVVGLVGRMRAVGVELIYHAGYPLNAGQLAREMRAQGLNARLVSGDTLADRQFWEIAGETGEGTLVSFAPDPRRNPAAANVIAGFKTEGFEPAGYTLYAYAAVEAFAQAVTMAGTTDPDAVVRALHEGSFVTVLGPISFDAKGDVRTPGYVMYKWSGGQYSEL